MLTKNQFEENKTYLIMLYGNTVTESKWKRTRAFARLYAETEWSLGTLAAAEGLSPSRMCELVAFGQFLAWLESQGDEDMLIYEHEFQPQWRMTKSLPSDEARFAAVAAQCGGNLAHADSAHSPSRQLSKEIVSRFCDGHWHGIAEIAEALQAKAPAVRASCDRIVQAGTFDTFGERRPTSAAKGSFVYRFVKGGRKKIDLQVFYAEVKPVLDDMEKCIHGHSVDFSQQAMKIAFAQFRQVIDRVAR